MARLTHDDLLKMVESPADLEHDKIFSSRRSVFILDGKLIVAYNARCPYPSQISQKPDKFPLHHLHMPTYASNNTPYLCAAPAIPDYSGPILGRLAQTETHFPIIKQGSDFLLDPSVSKSWKDLEGALRAISRILTLSAQSYLSLDYKLPPEPSSYEYMGKFPTRQSAARASQRSRDAFQALIAHVSWSVLILRNRHMYDIVAKEKVKMTGYDDENDALSLDTGIFDNEWRKVLLDQGVHPAWIHELVRCTLCDFNITRAGIILHVPQEWAYHHLLPMLIISHVPIWMIWGNPQSPPTSIPWSKPMKSFYGPNRLERRFAHVWTSSRDIGNKRLRNPPKLLEGTTHVTSTAHDTPTPGHDSGPQPSETQSTSPGPLPSDIQSPSCEPQPLNTQSPSGEPQTFDLLSSSNEESPDFDTRSEALQVQPASPDVVQRQKTTDRSTQAHVKSPTATLSPEPKVDLSSSPKDVAQRSIPPSPFLLYRDFHDPQAQLLCCTNQREDQARSEDFPRSSASNNGLDIYQWMQVQKQWIASVKARASARQLHKYNQRELAASRHESPGRKGAVAFEWVRDDLDRPVRVHVPRAGIDQIWCMYGDKQRWYNCVKDEWELCSELDPSDTPDLDATSTLSSGGLESEEACPNGYLSGWGEVPSEDDLYHINAQLSASWDVRMSSRDSFELDILDLLMGRFGFSYSRGHGFIPLSKPQWSLSKSMRLLGDCKDRITFVLPEGQEAPAIQFAMHLSEVGHPDSSASNVPGILCDLSPHNDRYLGSMPSSVLIRTAMARGRPLYILTHKSFNENAWVLGVPDPCVALLAIRSNPLNLTDFAIHLIQSRTPFYTLRSVARHGSERTVASAGKRVGRRFGLGERPVGHEPDKADYIAYTGEKSRLLLNPRIARAAVKRGGILSRLVDSLVEERDILDGPSVSAEECLFSATLFSDDKEIYFIDDDITDEESSVLVGLYRIKPNECSSPAERSWWPTLPKYMDSGLNVGAWTPKCEDWFQKRLSKILDEQESTHTATTWRSHLKLDTDTKRVYKGARDLATRFIDASKGSMFINQFDAPTG